MNFKKHIIWGLIIFALVFPVLFFNIYNPAQSNKYDAIALLLASVIFIFLLLKHLKFGAKLEALDIVKIAGTCGITLGILAGTFNYLNYNHINPEAVDEILKNTQEMYEALGQTETQVKNGVNANRKLITSPFYHISNFTFLSVFIFGLIGLISNWIYKKRTESKND